MNRREFLGSAGILSAAAGLGCLPAIAAASATISASKIPRWRGFNLLEKFTYWNGGNPPYRESDFSMMAEWGFDFARLPTSYLCWTETSDWLKIREKDLKDIDQAVALGRQYRVHINLNLHRAPGYCVNPPKEPLDLWKDDKALEACSFHWAHFAKRYKGIANEHLSFDLLNEPPDIPEATYARVIKALVQAVRAEDSQRLIIADGLRWGTQPVPALLELGIAQSTHGYEPMQISHYKASWIHGSDTWTVPTWPLERPGKAPFGPKELEQERIVPWKALAAKGSGVHVGEWGAFNRTPHKVVLAWMRDCLALWKAAGWGWSLWNLAGGFGVLDSEREDVSYENFRNHKLDREMLEVLREG